MKQKINLYKNKTESVIVIEPPDIEHKTQKNDLNLKLYELSIISVHL